MPESKTTKAIPRLGRRGFMAGAVASAGAALVVPGIGSEALAAEAAAQKPASDLPPDARSLVPIPARRVSFALSKLDGIIADIRKRTGVPGLAAAVVYQGKLRYAKGFGTRNLRTGLPVTPDTVFQLASVSKSLAGAVVATIVGNPHNTVDWSDPIAKYLPDFTLSDPYVTANVTLADMLSHRSGLPGAAGDLLEDLGYLQDYILNRLRLEPLSPFRAQYAYTNFGFTTGGVAAAAAVGKEWADAAEELLFKPLGMSSTSYRHADFLKQPNHTAMHVRSNGKWFQEFNRNADQEAPAGGANSSVLDLAKWMRMELAVGSWQGKPFIDPDAIRETWLPHSLSNFPSLFYSRSGFYGLGTDVSNDATGRLRVSHSGAFFQGAATNYVLLPAEGLGIIVLTNGMPIGVPESITASFLDYVEAGSIQLDWLTGYGKLFAAVLANNSELAGKKPPSNPKPAHPNAFYTGTFQNAFYGPIRIVARNGKLHLLIGPNPNDYPLSHWDGDLFSFEPTGENAVGITAATFHPGSTIATGVTLEYYNADGLGTFTR
jgi:CubicO group peptidase (beta-lactamase class C family)